MQDLLEVPTEAPQEEDEDPCHYWCEPCDTKPRRALCGVNLENQPQLPDDAAVPMCPRCVELVAPHRRALHPSGVL